MLDGLAVLLAIDMQTVFRDMLISAEYFNYLSLVQSYNQITESLNVTAHQKDIKSYCSIQYIFTVLHLQVVGWNLAETTDFSVVCSGIHLGFLSTFWYQAIESNKSLHFTRLITMLANECIQRLWYKFCRR